MSDEQKNQRGRKPSITVSPRRDESQWSPEDVIAKRLAGNNVFGHTNDNSVPLKDRQAWHQRWFNNQSNPSQIHAAQRLLGWVPVRVEDLDGVSPESLGLSIAPDGTIRRGDRNIEEVLMKMPEHLYQRVQLKKAEKNVEGMGSESKARNDAANAAASAHGDQAAEYISKHANITIRDTQAPVG